MTPEVVVDVRAELGEGPCWDDRDRVLWWVDIVGQTLHRHDPRTGANRAFNIGKAVAAVAPRRSGGLLLALRDGFYGFDPATQALELIVAVEPNEASHRINDSKCDRAGRIWGGTMADDERPGAGSFYRFDPQGGLRRIWGNVTCSNGIGWSPDDRRMYYIDSGPRRIDVCAYDAPTGEVSNRMPFVQLRMQSVEPDGLTVDSEGYVWVALWGGGAVHRYRPDGSLDRVVNMPALNVTSCTFGGDDLETLYITSASIQTTSEQLLTYPLSGAVFAIRPGVQGLPTNGFAG